MRTKLLLLAALAMLVIAACSSASTTAWTYPPETAGGGTAPTAAPASAEPASADVLGALEVNAIDLGFEPTELSVPKPGRYAVTLINSGQIPHDIMFPDGTKGTANAGESVKVDMTVEDASAGDFDALLLPGGQMNPDILRMDEAAIELIKDFDSAGKPIAAAH